MSRKKTEEMILKMLMRLSLAVIIGVLLLIVWSVLSKGVPALKWSMISQEPKGGFYFGREGGILNAIAGSVYLAIGSTFLSLALGLPVALYMNVYLRKKRKTAESIRFFLDVLWGIPSIVYGAFGFAVMLWLGMRTSLLAGIFTVALFILPVMIRAMDEVFRTISTGLYEASYALGSTRSETAFRVILRQGMPGIVTAVLLAFGRSIGDAASVLLTTGYTDHVPTSLYQPAATLPLAVFFQLGSPLEEVKQRAYASAVVLTLIILLVSVTARLMTRKYDRTKITF
jgi:phosphate transport system permease protein